MNHILASVIDNHCPKFSEKLVEGTAKEILANIPSYLDVFFGESILSLNSSVDFKYHGYRRMTPYEEFITMLGSTNNKTMFDLAVDDLYMVEYLFKFNKRDYKRTLYLPFAEKGNIMRISSTPYVIVPVLSDTVISPSPKSIFVRLFKDKMDFISRYRNFVVNGVKTPGQIIHCAIVRTNNMKLEDKIGKPLTPIGLYLLGRYGLKATLEKYMGIKDVIVTDKDTSMLADKYHIFESTKEKPGGHKDYVYVGHDVKICIPNKYEITPLLENFIFGIIYALDILPREDANTLAVCNGNNLRREILHWRIILGKITYKGFFSINRITTDMDNLFDALEGYMDSISRTKLREAGTKVNNLYDLIAVILDQFSYMMRNSKEHNSDINNRYKDIPYYMLYDIIAGFNRAITKLNRRASKTNVIMEKELNSIFKEELSPKKFYHNTKSQSMTICFQMADYTSDIKYPKCTALLEDQSRGNGVKRGKKNKFPESTRSISAHDIYLGSTWFITKSTPSPRFRSNTYSETDDKTGRLIIPPDIEVSINKLDQLLTGTIDNTDIDVFEMDASDIEQIKVD